MNLLEQELNKNKKPTNNAKKIVLTLLILCIILLIVLLAVIFVLRENKPVKESFIVDGAEITVKEGGILSSDSGTKYISIEYGAELLGYKYFNGEYGKNEEDRNKCYLQNENEVIGFEFDNNKIYKINLKDEMQPQYYDLANNVIKKDDKLYLTLEDFSKSCNVALQTSSDGKKTEFSTCKYLSDKYSTAIAEQKKYKTVDTNYENLKAIYYGMAIVSDGSNYGVINSNLETIIGAKYNSITFNEYTQEFIAVDNNNKYGVISKDGKKNAIDFRYESISIINYSPLLYEVKQNNKYGVLDNNGNIIVNIEYDKLGSSGNDKNNSVLIIEDVNSEKEDGIVVYSNGKYGIVNIKTGKLILECNLEKVYSKTLDDDSIVYYVQIEGNEIELSEYIKNANTTVVNL